MNRPKLLLVDGSGIKPKDVSEPPRTPGGEPPDDMERRLSVVEQAVGETRGDIKAINGDLQGIRERLTKVEVRLDHMPTTLQMWVSMIGAAGVIMGGLYWILKLLLTTTEGQSFLVLLLKASGE